MANHFQEELEASMEGKAKLFSFGA